MISILTWKNSDNKIEKDDDDIVMMPWNFSMWKYSKRIFGRFLRLISVIVTLALKRRFFYINYYHKAQSQYMIFIVLCQTCLDNIAVRHIWLIINTQDYCGVYVSVY